ncbi:hypothetical protein A2cp1_4208 [Anaeromyxobacter dehalogenans 2CP-1]|uniref:Uncharacterized protein n=1 Tax=Anaeromyxobacter dehalogenans (strain ATCC BAA-258 / DSM 21875 / 2CP-1) TaxID=455488 RepID=B8JAM6_ANAD2|nr:DUF4279 domain-containing protein [Anaeromyxobacter dehalogenans]ACL67525.1 hypothetical protein A2cp1_4208 [Anaeromyxobacter dehalogenans 2CP-1]
MQDRTHVRLAMTSDDLDPDAVTAIVGLTPTRSHRKGDVPAGHRVPWYRGALWFAASCILSPLTVARGLDTFWRRGGDEAGWAQVSSEAEARGMRTAGVFVGVIGTLVLAGVGYLFVASR